MTDTTAEAAAPSLFRRVVDVLDWKVNPVLLRDLRLYMRGKLMLALYFLTLASLFMIAVLYAVIARNDQSDGTGLLSILTYLMAVICGAMIPNLVFERFRSELSNRATELALTSPLTPAQLVRGKLMGAWCMTLMVVSAMAPMLATAYLLGGVNLLGILGIVAGVTLAGMTLPMLQMAMAADFKGGKGLSRALAALLFVAELSMMMAFASLLANTFIGVPGNIEWNYATLISLAVAAVLIGQFLYFNTVNILRGEAEDRDAAPRLSLTAAAVLGGLAAYGVYRFFAPAMGISGSSSDFWSFMAFTLCVVAFAFCLGFTAVCQSSPLPPRHPHGKWRRWNLGSLFLKPGVASLTAYFLLHMAVMVALCLICNYFIEMNVIMHWRHSEWWKITCVVMAAFMSIAYGLLVYYYIVLPLVKDKRNPKLLSYTIGTVSIVMALFAVFIMILTSYLWGRDELYGIILGVTPVGLITAAIQGKMHVAAGKVGLGTLVVLSVFMLGIVRGHRRIAMGEEADEYAS